MEDKQILEMLALDYLKDKKRVRRWRYIKWFIVILLILILLIFSKPHKKSPTAHIGLINISGPIFSGTTNSLDNVHRSLLGAYRAKQLKALVLQINSPGGSPVQADEIYQELRAYKKRFPKIKIYAVCTDLCASAAYYIAAAADEIYANPSSLVGSIGVLYNGFGFVDAMKKIGVERRLITAGQHKGFLDPFSVEKPAEVKHLTMMLNTIHERFKKSVIQGRGGKLQKNNQIFSGLIWTGEHAKKNGLIDGYGNIWTLSRNTIKVKKIIDYTYKEPLMLRLSRHISEQLGFQLHSFLKGSITSEYHH